MTSNSFPIKILKKKSDKPGPFNQGDNIEMTLPMNISNNLAMSRLQCKLNFSRLVDGDDYYFYLNDPSGALPLNVIFKEFYMKRLNYQLNGGMLDQSQENRYLYPNIDVYSKNWIEKNCQSVYGKYPHTGYISTSRIKTGEDFVIEFPLSDFSNFCKNASNYLSDSTTQLIWNINPNNLASEVSFNNSGVVMAIDNIVCDNTWAGTGVRTLRDDQLLVTDVEYWDDDTDATTAIPDGTKILIEYIDDRGADNAVWTTTSADTEVPTGGTKYVIGCANTTVTVGVAQGINTIKVSVPVQGDLIKIDDIELDANGKVADRDGSNNARFTLSGAYATDGALAAIIDDDDKIIIQYSDPSVAGKPPFINQQVVTVTSTVRNGANDGDCTFTIDEDPIFGTASINMFGVFATKQIIISPLSVQVKEANLILYHNVIPPVPKQFMYYMPIINKFNMPEGTSFNIEIPKLHPNCFNVLVLTPVAGEYLSTRDNALTYTISVNGIQKYDQAITFGSQAYNSLLMMNMNEFAPVKSLVDENFLPINKHAIITERMIPVKDVSYSLQIDSSDDMSAKTVIVVQLCAMIY